MLKTRHYVTDVSGRRKTTITLSLVRVSHVRASLGLLALTERNTS